MTNGKPLALEQTADGGSISPQLTWSGYPPQTQSFLLTCYDPDAPREGGFWHWLVADIPVTVTSIPSGSAIGRIKALANRFFRPPSSIGVPEAIDLPNSAGLPGFMGAAPPKGDRAHRYFFAIQALEVAHLELPHGRKTAPALVSATAIPYTIARGVLMGTFQR
ncbi:MAG: YbhB/YbcL family Raf kinase inhibitor-like protein [Propionibacteriaceae bacterium]|jgi:Raf kinase inhibitor-like YbhB/YbcL family protein|nr:YbhB/YbcL family Raf kinase inhibitor-like protein [Propionibacteriaceae bacterium]